MSPLLTEIRQNRLLWLLAGVPVLFAVQAGKPDAHTALFVLSILAIVPLAALLSCATESVAAKTGGYGRRTSQRNSRKPDGTDYRTDRLARRAIRSRESVDCRRDRHEHIVHAGCVFCAGRTQASCTGIQSKQRPASGGPSVSGHDRPVDPIDAG